MSLYDFIVPEEENQEARDDAESVTSIETAALLRKLLPNSSPLSEMQVQLYGGRGGWRGVAVGSSRQKPDVS